MLFFFFPYGGIRSRRMSQLAHHLLPWSHTQRNRSIIFFLEINCAAYALLLQFVWENEDSTSICTSCYRLCLSFYHRDTCALSLEFPTWRTLNSSTSYTAGPGACVIHISPVSLLTQILCKVREDEEHLVYCTLAIHNQTCISTLSS